MTNKENGMDLCSLNTRKHKFGTTWLCNYWCIMLLHLGFAKQLKCVKRCQCIVLCRFLWRELASYELGCAFQDMYRSSPRVILLARFKYDKDHSQRHQSKQHLIRQGHEPENSRLWFGSPISNWEKPNYNRASCWNHVRISFIFGKHIMLHQGW